MKKLSIILTIILSTFNIIWAQSIKVGPYLQDASPHSIFILWETDSGEESIVEWGLTEGLGNSTIGTSEISVEEARIHTVELVNLEHFTEYFYRVKTGNAVSEIYNFKTPPHASDHEPFRIVVMSDMQRDGDFPDKFNEIIHDGILDFLDDEFGGDLIDNLALVLVPGDLVASGNNYPTWESHFFSPAHDLFSHIPVYPVPGNHDENTIYYFQYFNLPDNGTPSFEEHWWFKDYGNVRIIGLDSNSPFTNQEQLDWLDVLLTSTCAADSIDFVFAQLHHPHKSELWTPGEIDYTGEVIEKLEQFSTECGKPSIHFFGHTHAYSRGNSRDHKHLWINAATAGGAIDNWGEFPNFDYDEFSVSQDEYGFVSVEVSSGADPTIVIKRISRGDQDATIDNEITDSMILRKNPSVVNTPIPDSPINEELIPECVTLYASPFSSPNTLAQHGQSHWQVSLSENDFSNPVSETWKNFENWYFEVDTQMGDDLTDEKINGLQENETYWWRVRYRDKELNWSNWTDAVSFSTGESPASDNLLFNNGAEDDLNNWTVIEGIVEALTEGECNGISPHTGNKYFAVGGLCNESEVGICVQNVNIDLFSDSIDAGNYSANYGGYFSNFSGGDLPEMRLIFLNQDNAILGTSPTVYSLANSWTLLSERDTIPEQTRTIQIELKGTRNEGTDNDSYFDDLFLTVGPSIIDCSGGVTSVNHQERSVIEQFNLIPNPLVSTACIVLPEGKYTNIKLSVIDTNGVKINCQVKYEPNKITIERGNLAKGSYFFIIRDHGIVIGTGKFIVI